MSKKDKKIILIAQCLVNPYCRVHILGQNFPLSQELTNYLMEKRVGIIQYPCPETTAMGLQRNPQGRQQYDSIFFRNHCKDLLKTTMLMVREFIKNKYRLTCFIGLENSPTCGIHWGKHKVNRYQTESPMPVDKPELHEPVLKGIMAEILEEELAKEDVNVPFLEFPTQSQPSSEKRKKFWANLAKTVQPYLFQDKPSEIICPTCMHPAGPEGHLCVPFSEKDEKCEWCGALIAEEKHLCDEKIKNISFICNSCGRTAVKAEHLCSPKNIK